MVKIIKNALDKGTHKQILDLVSDPYNFPLYFSSGVASEKYINKDFFFVHTFYYHEKELNNPYFKFICLPLLGLIKFKKLLRIKLNCYVNQKDQIKHGFHHDFTFSHKVALYNINTNNGYTEFETGEKITSKANELILFNGKIKHRSVSQNNEQVRYNININYE